MPPVPHGGRALGLGWTLQLLVPTVPELLNVWTSFQVLGVWAEQPIDSA
jgi:hypothetical protein